MRGKWAAGIPPRNFTWIIKDQLAVSERPGGSAPNHRRVRRQEEIIWLRVQGFVRVVSLLSSPHNLAAYEEGGLACSHFPLSSGAEIADVLADLYSHLDAWLTAGERVLIHQEELGDQVTGVVAGYLLWCRRLPAGPQAIAVTERLIGRQIGPPGRDLVAEVVAMRATGSLARRLAGRGVSAPPAAPEGQEQQEQHGPEDRGRDRGRERHEEHEDRGEPEGQDAGDRPVVGDNRAIHGAEDGDVVGSPEEADGPRGDLGA